MSAHFSNGRALQGFQGLSQLITKYRSGWGVMAINVKCHLRKQSINLTVKVKSKEKSFIVRSGEMLFISTGGSSVTV